MTAQTAIDQFLNHDIFRQMLLEKGSISLKGIGSIKIERNSAILLPAEQNLLPPSYNLVLVEQMDQPYDEQYYFDLYLGGSKYSWSDFNQLVLNHLMNYGKFQINGVGSLIREASGKISYSADAETLQLLNTGYPVISLKPVKREYTPTHLELNPEPLNIKQKKTWGIKRFLVLISMFLVAMMMYRYLDYMFQWSAKSEDEIVGAMDLESHDYGIENVKKDAKISTADNAETVSAKSEEIDVLSEESLRCIIITGSFKRTANADRMIKRLTDMGYSTYTEKFGAYTRVGVAFECAESKLIDSITSIRKKVNIQSWFLSPDLAVETM